MPREDFRRDLRGAFESISGPSSPSLSARVHEALVDAPERRGGPVWLAGVAVAVIAVILVGILFVAGPLSRRQILPIPGASPSPSASASPSASPSPAASPSPTDNLPAFQCASTYSVTGYQSGLGVIDGVRTGTHQGYDRITIEFQGRPSGTIELTTQNGTTFYQDGSGAPVHLEGNSGILIKLFDADAHTAYSGPIDIKTGYKVLVEAHQVGDYEGYVHWALGLSAPACYRAFVLTNPDRLVIDIQTS